MHHQWALVCPLAKFKLLNKALCDLSHAHLCGLITPHHTLLLSFYLGWLSVVQMHRALSTLSLLRTSLTKGCDEPLCCMFPVYL